MLKNQRYHMSRLALYIILGALRPRTSAARKVQIILPQTVGNTADTVLSDPAPSQEAEEPPSSVQPLEESHVSEQPPELVTIVRSPHFA